MTLSRLKKRLKEVPAVYRLNASLKAAKLHRRKQRIDRQYEQKLAGLQIDTSVDAAKKLIAERYAARGFAPPRKKGALRIYCVGTYYDQENTGFLQGLAALGDLVVFQNDLGGGYGLRGAAIGHDDRIREANGRCLVDQVERAHRERPIDVLIGTMVGQNTPLEALQRIQSLGIPVLNIAMDDRTPDHWESSASFRYGPIGLADATDLVLQTTPEYLPRYFHEKCPAVFWPYGSDPELFKPSAKKEHDVLFVGHNYGWRKDLIARIEKAGVRVSAYGEGFPNGPLAPEDVGTVFGKSRIVLGYGYVAYSRRVTTLKLRDIDGPMSGSLYLSTYNPDLALLYDLGREIDTYRDFDECVAKIKHYLADAPKREAIAAAGRARALRDYVWIDSLRRAFELVGVLETR